LPLALLLLFGGGYSFFFRNCSAPSAASKQTDKRKKLV
jgi:hypothetical protein